MIMGSMMDSTLFRLRKTILYIFHTGTLLLLHVSPNSTTPFFLAVETLDARYAFYQDS